MARPRKWNKPWQEYTQRVGDCLLWTGPTAGRGYPTHPDAANDPDARGYVHRLVWKEKHGPIPTGMQVLHTCDVPRCVEETHLWLGTPSDNMYDKVHKNRHFKNRGELHPCVKLTDAQREEIRRRHDEAAIQTRRGTKDGERRRFCETLAIEYCVSWGTINHVVLGHTRGGVAA